MKPSLKSQFALNRTQLDILIATLNLTIQQAEKGVLFSTNSGICGNWRQNLQEAEIRELTFRHPNLRSPDILPPNTLYGGVVALVRFIAMDWKHSAQPGVPTAWPVPNNQYVPMWAGSQLKLRLSLMRHITKRLRDWRRRTV